MPRLFIVALFAVFMLLPGAADDKPAPKKPSAPDGFVAAKAAPLPKAAKTPGWDL